MFSDQDKLHEEEAVDPLAISKPYSCEECAMKFPTPNSLQLHLSVCRQVVCSFL
jgi:hypothetical protein